MSAPGRFRVGTGFDVHPFSERRRLVLGGVTIPHPRGLAGHSDADALAHALIDALLGAAGLGDIGSRFPPGDPRYADVDSLALLAAVSRAVRSAGWQIANVDATVIAEQPRLAPYIPEMRQRLAAALEVGADRVSVKAKTAEGLGALGRAEGIAAQAVALLERVEGQR